MKISPGLTYPPPRQSLIPLFPSNYSGRGTDSVHPHTRMQIVRREVSYSGPKGRRSCAGGSKKDSEKDVNALTRSARIWWRRWGSNPRPSRLSPGCAHDGKICSRPSMISLLLMQCNPRPKLPDFLSSSRNQGRVSIETNGLKSRPSDPNTCFRKMPPSTLFTSSTINHEQSE